MSKSITIEPLDRIEQLRCDLLRGFMRRDAREWARRAAERNRAEAPDGPSQPHRAMPQPPHDPGFTEYRVAGCGRVR
jgi:hypothetical protein